VARSPGGIARQAGKAACARSMCRSVSSTDASATSVTGCSVAGLITV
jgi:hypothetical protein